MVITKLGDVNKAHGEFHFRCHHCRCEWLANRGDKGLGISPPFMEFFVYMKCPNCKEEVISK